MLTESCPSVKLNDVGSTFNDTPILDDHLGVSSSFLGQTDKSLNSCSNSVVYVNEETMDCSYSGGSPSQGTSRMDLSSPDMFESDNEDKISNFGESIASIRRDNILQDLEKFETCQEELVVKSDNYLLARMNKFLTGVPPPPKHTICQRDCGELLACIRQNREYFLIDPLIRSNESSTSPKKVENCKNFGRSLNHRAKSSLRNLTNAFDACETNNCEIKTDISGHGSSLSETLPTSTKNVTLKISKQETAARFYTTISVEEVKKLEWDSAYRHKTHGIHYNRSKTIEEFDSLMVKLCQRYIGAETQSSCNIWFTKQAPSSVKKRNLLLGRNNGQSPGKRLSHLAKRRRTFSSANLQIMGMPDKKQLVLNIKKPTIKKGKSPRRGKSPRGSAKKGARPSPSPRKSKVETSKRALFQSPPNDRSGAGPSNRVVVVPTTLANSSNPQRIKRALFSTTKNNEEIGAAPSFEESRKRKNEDELEGPRYKWAKSLSFDCPRGLESSDSWTTERHSTGNFIIKNEAHMQQGKCQLSEAHRRKLLMAVVEALRSRGIGTGHPRFKQCFVQLTKTVKKYMPDLENRNIPRKPGSTTDRMLKLAKHHVLLIVESRSEDGIQTSR